MIADAGFAVDAVERGYLPGPVVSRPFAYLYRGVASVA